MKKGGNIPESNLKVQVRVRVKAKCVVKRLSVEGVWERDQNGQARLVHNHGGGAGVVACHLSGRVGKTQSRVERERKPRLPVLLLECTGISGRGGIRGAENRIVRKYTCADIGGAELEPASGNVS